MPGSQFAVGVLAGDRAGPDAIARAENVASKVLVDIAGVPMLQRVLDTVSDLEGAARVHLSGPEPAIVEATPWLSARIQGAAVTWQPPRSSPARSAAALLEAAFLAPAAANEAAIDALLLTTGDHPLLSAGTAARFVADALGTEADVVVGLAKHALVQAAFPEGRRTALKLADGPFCGCNLMLFRGPKGGSVLDFWQTLETERKRPGRMAATLGFGIALRYLSGRLTAAGALARIGQLTGVRVAAVAVDDPDAAVDVDSLADLALVRARFGARSG
ncbi:MAG: NTP transferase domain-containing protein [Gammaproteobacteria bacterium]|nr:NTP transferase domain-containing protein [Gammaproteobacteria bacterium]